MKVCINCNESKPVDQFQKIKDSRLKDGFRLHSYCKACKAKVDRKWALEHKYEMKAYREARK